MVSYQHKVRTEKAFPRICWTPYYITTSYCLDGTSGDTFALVIRLSLFLYVLFLYDQIAWVERILAKVKYVFEVHYLTM